MKKKVLLVLLLVFLPLFPVLGQAVSSPNYQLQDPRVGIGTVDSTAPGAETKISSKLGRASATQFLRDGYLAWLGFSQIKSNTPFNLTVSNVSSTTSTDIIVNYSALPGYKVTAQAEDVLRTLNNNVIENTKCDRADPCTFAQANSWTSDSAYGFGFNMGSEQPSVVPADFLGPTYFRSFANRAGNQDPAVIMSSSLFNQSAEKTDRAKMTYKVKVPASQSEGTYTTIIELTALPPY